MTILDIYNFSETTKDAYKLHKEKYKDYDVVIMNVFNNIYIDIINPDLQQ